MRIEVTYLTDGVQSQGMVKGVSNLEDVGGGDDGSHDMIDALEGLERTVKEAQDGLVLGDIDGMEDCAGRHARLVERRPGVTAFLCEGLTVGTIEVTDADKGTTLAAELGETGPDTVGAAWGVS